jgi:hypothetical protein
MFGFHRILKFSPFASALTGGKAKSATACGAQGGTDRLGKDAAFGNTPVHQSKSPRGNEPEHQDHHRANREHHCYLPAASCSPA